MSNREAPTAKCLNPNCSRPQKCRGLCCTCYGVARKLILEKRTTWKVLCANGKSNPTWPRRGKTTNWLLSQTPEA
jgi:hypothetical protein